MIKIKPKLNSLDDIGYTVSDHRGTVLKHHEGKGRYSMKAKSKALSKAKAGAKQGNWMKVMPGDR